MEIWPKIMKIWPKLWKFDQNYGNLIKNRYSRAYKSAHIFMKTMLLVMYFWWEQKDTWYAAAAGVLAPAARVGAMLKAAAAVRLVIFMGKLESQTDHLRPLAATVHCGLRPQHFWGYRESIWGFLGITVYCVWRPQRDCINCSIHYICHSRSFTVTGHHSSLWTKATTFLRSQRGYLWPLLATVYSGRRPQHLKSHAAVLSTGVEVAEIRYWCCLRCCCYNYCCCYCCLWCYCSSEEHQQQHVM